MLFSLLTAVFATIVHFQSAIAHPHQLYPLHAHKVRMLQWDFRNADHQDVAPSTTAFQHQRRSQHVPVNRLGAPPLDKTPVPAVQDNVWETKPSHLPRLEPESIQIPSEPPVDPEHNHAFEVIQHAFLPSGVPRGWLEAQQQAKTSRGRKLKARKALMARMRALTATIVEALEDEPSALVASKRSPLHLQDYTAKSPMSKMETKQSRKREPTPFAGNHVVDLEAVKQLVSWDTKRTVPDGHGSLSPGKSPFADLEEE